jgi:polar amino acid transport system substrate-binding protein
MNMKKILCLVVALLLVVTCLAGCGAKKDDTKLVMATNANFPPYEYMEGDEYAGIDIEMAQKLAEKLGKELVIENVEFGSIVTGVQSGKYDVGVAGMTVTDERKEKVNFSDSYATGIQVVIVKEDSAIKTPDDLAGADVMIGVQQDTTGHIYAADTVENGGYGEDHVTPYLNGADAVNALVTDKVDAVIIDNEPAKAFVAANKGLKILETEWLVEDYAIAINKEDTELLDNINKALSELKADGTIKSIIDKYIPAE